MPTNIQTHCQVILLAATCFLAGCIRAEEPDLPAHLVNLTAGRYRELAVFHRSPELQATLAESQARDDFPPSDYPAAWLVLADVGRDVPADIVRKLWVAVDDDARSWPERLTALLALRLVDTESREALRRFSIIFGETYVENRIAMLDGTPERASARAQAAAVIHLAMASRLYRETPDKGVDLLLSDTEPAIRRGAIALEIGFILSRDWERPKDNRGYDWKKSPEENAAAIAAWQAYTRETVEKTRRFYARERAAIEGGKLPDGDQALIRRKNELETILRNATTEAEKIDAGQALEKFLREEMGQEAAWVDYPGHHRPAPLRERRKQDLGWLAYRLKWSLEDKRLMAMNSQNMAAADKEEHIKNVRHASSKLQKAFGTPVESVPALAKEGLQFLEELRDRTTKLQGKGKDATPKDRYQAKQWAMVLHAYDKALEQEHQKDYHRYHQMMHIFATTQRHDAGLLDESQNKELDDVQAAIEQAYKTAGATPDEDATSKRLYPARVKAFRW